MPTRKTLYWVLGAAVLYLIAWNVGSGWLYVLTTLLLALPLLSLVISRVNTRGISARLAAPPAVTDGERFTASLEISNPSHIPRFFLELKCQLAGERRRLFLPALPARTTRRVSVEFISPRRGVYPDSRIRMVSSAPVGLSRSSRWLDAGCPLVVYPRWRRLAGDWITGQKNTGYMVSSAIPTRKTASDYLGVRDYRPGDSPRSIHWRSSARTGNLAVIEYARQTAITPVFLVDTYSEADKGEGMASTFEAAVIIAASLAQRECRNNRRFGAGFSPADAAARELHAAAGEAMYWLAQAEASSERPMDLSGSTLPWPEATPVLILTSHSAYSNLDEEEFLRAFPHSIVIMLDGRESAADSDHRSHLMDGTALEALAVRLESLGSEFLLISTIEEAALCLSGL